MDILMVRTLCLAMLIISIERSTAANAAPEGPQEANSQVIVRAAPQGGLPVVARITGDGTIHLLYEVNTELMCARSIDGGKTFDQGLPVVPTSPDPRLKFTGEDMAVTQTGRVFVALSTDGWKFKVPKEQMGFHLSILEPGKGSFGPVRNVNLMPSSGYALAVADDRQLALTWFSRTLYWSKSDDAGATFTPNTVVGADYQVCECCTTRAAYGANGDLAIMYRERTDNHRDMYVALIKKDGSHTRKRVSQVSWDINMCPMTYWDFHATANGYLAVWPTRGRLYFNRISADGDPVSVTEIKTDGQTTMRSQPLALTNSKDYVLIGWRQQGELRWQVYDAGNNPVGVRGSAPGASLAAAGVVDKFGQFILIP